MSDMKLYLSGLWASCLVFFGAVLTFIFFFVIFFSPIVGIIGLVFGIFLIIYGKGKRFEFQRKSGHIIHRGD